MKQDIRWRKINGKDNYYVSFMGEVYSKTSNKLLKLHVASNGYVMAPIQGKNYLVHRLVAAAFIENPSKFPCVNHIDGNKENNAFINLEWCDHSRNILHALKLGLRKSKISVEEKKKIKKSLLTTRELADQYGVSTRYIWNVKNRAKIE